MTDTATDERPEHEIAREKLAALIAAQGLEVSSEFICFSESRNAKGGQQADGKPWLSLNWNCSVSKKGVAVLTADYSAGSGHAPAAKASAARLNLNRAKRQDKQARAELVAFECETGHPAYYGPMGYGNINRIPKAAPIMPDPVDVLASLFSDADVLDAGGFENWAADLGYDTDSRRAAAIYKVCLENSLRLRAVMGEALGEASELARQL